MNRVRVKAMNFRMNSHALRKDSASCSMKALSYVRILRTAKWTPATCSYWKHCQNVKHLMYSSCPIIGRSPMRSSKVVKIPLDEVGSYGSTQECAAISSFHRSNCYGLHDATGMDHNP